MRCILPSYLVIFLPVVPNRLLLYFLDRMLNNDVADSYCAVVVAYLLVNLMLQYHDMLLLSWSGVVLFAGSAMLTMLSVCLTSCLLYALVCCALCCCWCMMLWYHFKLKCFWWCFITVINLLVYLKINLLLLLLFYTMPMLCCLPSNIFFNSSFLFTLLLFFDIYTWCCFIMHAFCVFAPLTSAHGCIPSMCMCCVAACSAVANFPG